MPSKPVAVIWLVPPGTTIEGLGVTAIDTNAPEVLTLTRAEPAMAPMVARTESKPIPAAAGAV